jgi:hypothetical protein
LTFEEFSDLLIKEVKKEFPELKRLKKPVMKKPEELLEEAIQVKNLLNEMPSLPEQ